MDQVARTVLGLGLLAAVACAMPLVDGVRQTRAVLWAAARGAVQLLAVGLLLGRCSAPRWPCCRCWR